MSQILELFGHPTNVPVEDWSAIVEEQRCPFRDKVCYKVRKSDPSVSIGTCSVTHGRLAQRLLICPWRFLESSQIFMDCLHLLTTHEPGNELHIVSEVAIPGGTVDYFVVSTRDREVFDFVGVELQALDTTGTIWPERQRLLAELRVKDQDLAPPPRKTFGMNWKMTAKTSLMQMYHKVRVFERINRKLVLVVQDRLLDYMRGQFNFAHLQAPALLGNSMHLHAYRLDAADNGSYRLGLAARLSTDADGVARCLGLREDVQSKFEDIARLLKQKITDETRFLVA